MKTKLLLVPVALLLAALVATASAQTTAAAAAPESAEQRDARMAWWREAKFGLFIHWGVYSVPAGEWNGKRIWGGGEWIMNAGQIPVADYVKLPAQFNPVKFDAVAWVEAAKRAGMKYIVITAKHHDGFAMFKSAASAFNIVDATPFKRDPLAELAAACRKAGLKLGFYYSQAQDWTHPGGSAMIVNKRAQGHWDPAQDGSMDEYIDQIAVKQVRELLSNYGEYPAVLWWDTSTGMNPERAEKLRHVVSELKPGIITNNRLGGGFKGDTETPEQVIPPQGYPGRDWETCMTMNGTWGFKSYDDKWKSPETLIRNLCDIASKGGNYLLNVGPTSEGLFPQQSLDRLADLGAWMRVNGEAIYGTHGTPFGDEAGQFSETDKAKDGKPKFIASWEWRCTTKPHKLYLHIFKWPANGSFELPGLLSKVRAAYVLADRRAATFVQSEKGVTLTLPPNAPDPIASVVCLEIADAVAQVRPTVVPGAEPGATVKAMASPIQEDSRLPRVMLIGDSISVGYTDAVRNLLAAKANVHRVQGNAGPSSSGVQKVDEWIAPVSGKWDVIHFNFGLHDVKLGTGGKDNHTYATADGHQVPADEYERNLRKIVARLKTTGAALIWASTTPVPTGKLDPLRRPGDEVKYNEIARKVMTESGVAIDDLYGVVTTGKPGLQQPANVHFTKEGSAILAQHVAASIQDALQRRLH